MHLSMPVTWMPPSRSNSPTGTSITSDSSDAEPIYTGNQLGDPKIIAEVEAEIEAERRRYASKDDGGSSLSTDSAGKSLKVIDITIGADPPSPKVPARMLANSNQYLSNDNGNKLITSSKKLRSDSRSDKENNASSSRPAKRPCVRSTSTLAQELHDQHIFQEKMVELVSHNLEELRAMRQEIQAFRQQRIFQEKMAELASDSLEELRAMRRELMCLSQEDST